MIAIVTLEIFFCVRHQYLTMVRPISISVIKTIFKNCYNFSESETLDWKDECNKTIFLSKEHPRTSVWSPAFPKHYPDNFNCLTLIFAPTGFRLVIDFEELVVENEPT